MIRLGFSLFLSALFSTGTAWAGPIEQRIKESVKGCEPYLTVQARQCNVQQTFQCSDGGFVQVLYEQNLATGIEHVGPQGEAGSFFSLKEQGGVQVFDSNGEFSMAQLRADGISGEEFLADVLLGGFDGRGLTASIEVTLSDETETISGIVFRKGTGALAISMPDGMSPLLNVLDIRVADDIGFLLSGQSTTTMGETTTTNPDHIMQVFRPGDDGFMVDYGLYDCGELG